MKPEHLTCMFCNDKHDPMLACPAYTHITGSSYVKQLQKELSELREDYEVAKQANNDLAEYLDKVNESLRWKSVEDELPQPRKFKGSVILLLRKQHSQGGGYYYSTMSYWDADEYLCRNADDWMYLPVGPPLTPELEE